MNKMALPFTLAIFLITTTSVALACEFTAGETKYLEYANCHYGADNILVVDLPENSGWKQCIYQLRAFRPETLLAVTKEEGGKEQLSINDRSKIGNPCYMTMKRCDSALQAFNSGQ